MGVQEGVQQKPRFGRHLPHQDATVRAGEAIATVGLDDGHEAVHPKGDRPTVTLSNCSMKMQKGRGKKTKEEADVVKAATTHVKGSDWVPLLTLSSSNRST